MTDEERKERIEKAKKDINFFEYHILTIEEGIHNDRMSLWYAEKRFDKLETDAINKRIQFSNRLLDAYRELLSNLRKISKGNF